MRCEHECMVQKDSREESLALSLLTSAITSLIGLGYSHAQLSSLLTVVWLQQPMKEQSDV